MCLRAQSNAVEEGGGGGGSRYNNYRSTVTFASPCCSRLPLEGILKGVAATIGMIGKSVFCTRLPDGGCFLADVQFGQLAAETSLLRRIKTNCNGVFVS